MNYSTIIEENKRRIRAIQAENLYNPLTGEGAYSVPRTMVEISDAPMRKMWLPNTMLEEGIVSGMVEFGSIKEFIEKGLKIAYSSDLKDKLWNKFQKIRFEHDFEFWAVLCCKIKKKQEPGKEDEATELIPFILNRPQRMYLKVLEELRLDKKPIRVIICKARQWGGSTETQMYMAWIQICIKPNLNSVICAHQQNTSRIIQGMYSMMLDHYPLPYTSDGQPYSLSPYRGAQNTSIIKQRGCRITIGSAEKPESVRGEDVSLAHLSEIPSWPVTIKKKPQDLLQSITNGIALAPYTMIVIESTAKGVGNFFHKEWNRAETHKSRYVALFISCFDADINTIPIENYWEFIKLMTDDDWFSWNICGATLEQINWYKEKLMESEDLWRTISEYPRTALEAFQSTGHRVFPKQYVDRMRSYCRKPQFVGDIVADATHGKSALINVKFDENPNGEFRIWAKPDLTEKVTNRYAVIVDIGGRSDKADFSVITVLDRYYMLEFGSPEVAARWVGHIDHDLLIWKAAQIATYYDKALLIPESNTLVTDETEGDHGEYILDEIVEFYNRLYCRSSPEQIRQNAPRKWGWHTNVKSKQLAIDKLIWAYREDQFIERDTRGCDEADTYEVKENGSLGATDGCHDDILITDAIGVFVCYDFQNFPMPSIVVERPVDLRVKRIKGVADF